MNVTTISSCFLCPWFEKCLLQVSKPPIPPELRECRPLLSTWWYTPFLQTQCPGHAHCDAAAWGGLGTDGRIGQRNSRIQSYVSGNKCGERQTCWAGWSPTSKVKDWLLRILIWYTYVWTDMPYLFYYFLRLWILPCLDYFPGLFENFLSIL